MASLEPLKLSVAVIPGEDRPGSVAVRVTLENVSTQKVRLLDAFEPDTLPVFFRVHLQREDGSPVLEVRGGGKADPLHSNIKYIDLAPGQTFSLTLNLADFLTDPDAMKPGRYQLTVTYFNQYGENCFHGRVTSAPLEFVIPQ